MSETLRALANAYGIHPGFHDLGGQYRTAAPETLRALLVAMDVPAGTEPEVADALAAFTAAQDARHLPQETVLDEGTPCTLHCPQCEWVLLDETDAVKAEGRGIIALPPLPFGYYHLDARGSDWREEVFVLCRPARGAPLVSELIGAPRGWGVVGALYGLRSDDNGGVGSFADLATAAQQLGQVGAQFLGVNPIHAIGWTARHITSPYSPTHRGFLNIDHIALPGMGPTPEAELIDYDAFRSRHNAALEARFAQMEDGAPITGTQHGLEDFATFEALSERYGDDSRTWPADLRRPGAKARAAAGPRARFHAWAQTEAERQLDHAARTAQETMGLGLYLDLAVGPRPGGAEPWMNPDTIARGVSIGAPPDHLNPEGQSWNLAAHAPRQLAAARYRPLRQMLSDLMRRAGLVRIDHALGLTRSFWQPEDGSPGGYITQPFESLLAVIAIEARRAHCVVIGEDLGLVPDGFRETMNAAGLLSYAVWQYETHEDGTLLPPEALRPFALSCFGTHDTPSIAGFWHGTDIAWWHAMGWQSGEETRRRHDQRADQRHRLRGLCALPPDARQPQITAAIHNRLMQSPSCLTALQLDDLFGQVEAQNLPGTIDEHPNWQRRLPCSSDALATAPDLRDTLPDSALTHGQID
ncbi:4-alpha-glucanotransferase [Sagittula marina]|uniref:4-alpha-glucanotransferase n=1 Tax=Sagittula marina TaxID=943940 RepID=A0A7W6GTG6_9RHOB|nr:4-alpha-glucanotransferase [Sagittula marina]MBB3986508.1 4-alpha-glucanotransferase [Sagittula marina]